MAFKHFLLAALTLALPCLPPPVETARNQYQKGPNYPRAGQPPSGATDSTLQVNPPHRPGRVEKQTNTGGGGLSGAFKSETARLKRGYSQWKGPRTSVAEYESFARWKPPTYQLSRPYYIPVYGVHGRVPLYFPPQSLNINPGTPMDNPVPYRPFKGPGYLPPPRPTTEASTTMEVPNRFNGDDDDDDRPIWGDASTTSPKPSSNGIIPTRPPRPPSETSMPPLVHDINSDRTFLSAPSESEESAVAAPPPPASAVRPGPAVSGPSNCVWAIVTCCSASSNDIAYSCFEQRGCPGPFWGMSPCDSDFARAAVAQALNYYNQ